MRQEEEGSVEGASRAQRLRVLVQEGGAQAPGLHDGLEVNVVLVQYPLRPGQDAEEVGLQIDGGARST